MTVDREAPCPKCGLTPNSRIPIPHYITTCSECGGIVPADAAIILAPAEKLERGAKHLESERDQLRDALRVMTDVFRPSGQPSEQGYVEQAAHDNARHALELSRAKD